jgi:predicted nucleic acid-binding protein
MKVAFADSYFYLAVLNPRDAGHDDANAVADAFNGTIVTTHWVLVEVADACAHPPDRAKFGRLLTTLVSDPSVQIIRADDALFERGVDLFRARTDKHWSLTDCISFVVMQDQGVRDALTADIHFEQAGFMRMLAAE